MPSDETIKRVLITGGSGFLGGHLCDRLLGMGCQVICVDNLLTGDAANIVHHMGNDGFRFVNQDVVDLVDMDGDLDAVLHFASPASPKDYLQFPLETLKVGALGTRCTLELAEAKGARYILASTSEVYGDPLVNPQPETYWGNVNPISPRGVYDEAKRFAEAITMAYHRYHGLDTRIVRIFNTYGPQMRPDDGRMISNFVVQALRGESITVYGDGSQTRSFCYIDDTVEAIIKVLLKDSDKTIDERTNRDGFLYSASGNGQSLSVHDPINVGNPEELSVLEVAKLILDSTGSASAIEFKPLPIDDPRVRRPDISKAKSLLEWQPRFSLRDGLVLTIEYFTSKLAAQVAIAPSPRLEG